MEEYLKSITIGRNPDNDIIVNYPDVDCHHCRIEMVGEEGFRIINMNNATVTFVNGKRVKGSMIIGPYDKLQVGTHDVAWAHQFSEESISIPPAGYLYTGENECFQIQQEDIQDAMKRKRTELSRKLLNGETIAFGEGGKIVEVDSEEAIGIIPPGKFSTEYPYLIKNN